MKKKVLLWLLGCMAPTGLGACSSDKADKTAETPLQQAAALPPGTTVKGADGSKIKKQADGDLKVKDAQGNVVKQDAAAGTVKTKTVQ